LKPFSFEIETLLLKRRLFETIEGRAILKMHLVGSQKNNVLKQFGKDMMHQINILTLVSRGHLSSHRMALGLAG
jgi:hypothetical protein